MVTIFLSQDHYFDAVTNAIGLVAAILGDKFYWWIDPVGAIVLALYTIFNWCETRSKKKISNYTDFSLFGP